MPLPIAWYLLAVCQVLHLETFVFLLSTKIGFRMKVTPKIPKLIVRHFLRGVHCFPTRYTEYESWKIKPLGHHENYIVFNSKKYAYFTTKVSKLVLWVLKLYSLIRLVAERQRWKNAAGIIPITNPTSTIIFKGLLAIKTRNAICFSPHPSTVKVCAQTMGLIARNVVHSIILDGNAISLILVYVHLYVHEFTSRVLSVALMHSLNQIFCFRWYTSWVTPNIIYSYHETSYL